MKVLNVRSFLVLAMRIALCLPAMAKAAPPPYTSPEMAKKLGQFRKEAGGAFIVPQVFGSHPGATFVLMHAKDLGLSDKQIKKIRMIRRGMVNRSLKQIARIDKMRARYLDLMKSPNPPLRKARKVYMKLTRLMAMATFDHLTGHVKVGKVLTKDQWSRLKSLP